jgi:subtilisin
MKGEVSMKRLLSLITCIVLIVVLASTSFAYGEKSKVTSMMKPYFVSFDTKVDLKVIKSFGGEIKRQYKYMPVVAVNLPEKAVQALTNNPKVDFIEEDGKVQAIGQVTPWGIPHIKAIEVQQTGVIGSGIKVGIIDTGIDYTHEDLIVSGGATFVQGTIDYMDDNGHGTHVAGTVAALDNTVGVLGVAPNVHLYGIKVLDGYGSGSYSDVISGIEWAISNNIDILNMSLGGRSGSKTLQTAVDNAYNKGMLLVAAAGNSGYDRKGTIGYPAKYDSVIAVGAVDEQNNRADFSSVGKELEIMAPGVSILSTILGGYDLYNGTSMASPHVAGVAALVWDENPNFTNDQIRDALNETTNDIGDSFSYGNGLVDALSAVHYSGSIENTKGGGKKKSNR